MFLKMDLPVFPIAHPFIHSSFLADLMICCAVIMDDGSVVCGCVVPCFANLSARSLPGMFRCPGIHCRDSLTAPTLVKWEIVLERLRIDGLSNFLLSSAWSTDFASVKMATFFLLFSNREKVFKRWCREASIASASASKFEQ